MCKKLVYVIPFVFVLSLIQTSLAQPVDPSLIGWWKFDEGSGTTAADSSGKGNNGTVNGGAAWVPGLFGTALDFDGGDDYVGTGKSLLNNVADFTMTGWVKSRNSTASRIGLFGQNDLVEMGFMGGNAEVWTAVSGTTNTPWPYNNVDEWHHLAVVDQGSTMTIYIDGEAKNTGSGGTHATSTDFFNIGGGGIWDASGNWFDGQIDDVRLYNRALTAAEIKKLMPPKLKAYKPSPADGATGVMTPLLQWTAGDTAAFHDVYFGTNPTPGPAEFKIRQTWAVYWGGSLTPGTTYYWRIDEVEADGVTIHTGDVWKFTAAPFTAYNPNPPDGGKWVTIDADLTWSAGAGGVWHDVYFGSDQTAVANGTGGTFKGKLGLTTYEPGTLVEGATYYWRIDEYDSGGTKYTGQVWSFKTRPKITPPDPDMEGWWKLDNEGTGTAIDYSGNDRDGTLMGDPEWVAGYDGDALFFDGDDYVDTGYTENLARWTITCWVISPAAPSSASPSGPVHREQNYQFNWNHGDATFRAAAAINVGGTWYAASYSPLEANTWYHLAATFDGSALRAYRNGVLITTNTAAAGTPTAEGNSLKFARHAAAAQFFTGTVDDVRVYSRALTAEEIKQTMRGDPTLAWNPKPADKVVTDIERAVPLSWSPGEKAAQHDVYFGTNQTAVDNATTASTGIYRGRQAAANYTPPEGLQWGGGPYYWRIDEYNTDGTVSTGRLWSFSVADYLIVDDFEDYTDDVGSRIFQTWKDGWGYSEPAPGYPGNGTGSAVGYSQAPFAEQTTIHGGSQSMPLGYDNSGTGGKARYSETFREWASPQDWTRYDIKALTLYFYGALANAAEQLYVAVEDNAAHVKVVNHPDPEAIEKAGWQEWNIELTQFSAAGVNLKAIKKMYIGLGNRTSPKAGGTGTIFIDDMRLYPSRCIPSFAKPAADLSGNCVVDAADVDILANLWLDTGFQVTPVDPGTTGLIAHYPFEGNANDVVGGHNGTTVGLPTYTTGKIGQAIQLNGVDQMVDVGAVGVSGAAPRTVSGWAKANALVDALPNWINLFGFTGPSGNYLHFDIEVVEALGVRGYGIHVYGWERRIMPIDFEWHHLAASYDGTTTKWYGDGRLIGSDSSLVLNTPNNVHMGKRDDNENYWPGRVDEVRIYSRVLSDAQIASLAGHTSALSIPADLRQDNVINFKDFAVLADSWLEELLWP